MSGVIRSRRGASHSAAAFPRHGARFDVRTGEVLSRPASVDLAVHEVKVEGNDVLVRVGDDILSLFRGFKTRLRSSPLIRII